MDRLIWRLEARPLDFEKIVRKDGYLELSGPLGCCSVFVPSGAFDTGMPVRLRVLGSPLSTLTYTLSDAGMFHGVKAWLGPSDVEVGEARFDGRFELHGPDADGLVALFGPAGREAACELGAGVDLRADHTLLDARWIVTDAGYAVDHIQAFLAFRAALSVERWPELQSLGFEREGLGQWTRGPLQVAILGRPPRLVLELAGTFPLLCAGRDALPPAAAFETHNPVVDQLVRVGGNPDTVRPLLADEDFLAALLELVHGHPGSSLTPARIRLVVPGVPDEAPTDLLERIEDFARRLRAGS
ncbi:MAG TPA: hypothetical protein QGF58_03025 [Myxococcota bacterium]|nr:hypothetical protein [Myxococcota bacterium]